MVCTLVEWGSVGFDPAHDVCVLVHSEVFLFLFNCLIVVALDLVVLFTDSDLALGLNQVR